MKNEDRTQSPTIESCYREKHMSQETVGEGGSLGELDVENAPEQNENTPAADGDTPQVHDGNLTEGNTANTPQDDLATEHEMALLHSYNCIQASLHQNHSI